MPSAHGLAATIRSSQESEMFDLGGQNASTISNTMESAFGEPFDCLGEEKMIRLTFVTGAGKQARQKYDADASKTVVAVLQKCGYTEDRGASCVMECAGTYKLQHDTGKNLKTIVVFPMVQVEATNEEQPPEYEPLIPQDSPGYKICVSSRAVFENILKSKCPSWSQKKGCLESIQALKDITASLEEDLVKGVSLNESEQAFYNAVVNLDEKEAYVKQQAQAQVEKGDITQFELELLQKQNAERIATLEKQNKSTAKALQRKELLESMTPVSPHKLKYHADIAVLYKELLPLLQLEKETKGRLLTIQETASMTRKEEILEEIECLEDASRGWFEDDEAFASRVQASRDQFAVKRAKKLSSKKSVATIDAGTKVRVSKWVTPGDATGFSSSLSAKRRAKMKKGNVFGAMMMDSDSSSSEEEEEEEESEAIDGSNEAAATSSKSKKKKKRKRKKKSKQTTEEESDTAPTSRQGEEQEQPTALTQTVDFLHAYILPMVVALLGWIIGLVFGKAKKRGQRR